MASSEEARKQAEVKPASITISLSEPEVKALLVAGRGPVLPFGDPGMFHSCNYYMTSSSRGTKCCSCDKKDKK